MDLSLVIPTYNEKDNISFLIKKIFEEFSKNKINGEIIVVDDNSLDGTGEIVENLKKKQKNIQIIHRKGKLGLSSAVIEGWNIAKGSVLGVMDADLSHSPDYLWPMFKIIKNKEADFVIGSRYIKGGKIEGWNLKRKILSRSATLLAGFFTEVKDPMTGFFMIKKECIKNVDLNPKGFKILLELLIKSKYETVIEIPITFKNRTKGKSKAGTKEVFYLIQNLSGYLVYKKNILTEFFKFAVVGLIGTLVNVFILYLLTNYLGFYYLVSAVFSFFVAMSHNYLFNKLWTFKEKINHHFTKKYMKFFCVSLIALIVNLFFLYVFTEFFSIYYLISQVLAIGITLIINYAGNKIWTFQK